MIRSIVLALALTFSAGAFAQAATPASPADANPPMEMPKNPMPAETASPPTAPASAATTHYPVDMVSCRDGTMAQVPMKEKTCATHGGVGPPSAAAVPTGATAKCKDGTYTFSHHHSRACSHHGGVADWL